MMNRYVLYSLVIVITCLGLGVLLEYLIKPEVSGSIFARMGAFIVVIGTLISLRDINRVQIKNIFTKEQIKQIESLQENFQDRVHSNFLILQWKDECRNKTLQYEGGILVLGTAIWGFGDLLYCLVYSTC